MKFYYVCIKQKEISFQKIEKHYSTFVMDLPPQFNIGL
jgi:hypothetical protein